jgi:hypothetical protein
MAVLRSLALEDPASGGDASRYVPPFRSDEDSLFFEAFNRGKRSISLDSRHDEGARAFRDLARAPTSSSTPCGETPPPARPSRRTG